jgi:hypothetical protein
MDVVSQWSARALLSQSQFEVVLAGHWTMEYDRHMCLAKAQVVLEDYKALKKSHRKTQKSILVEIVKMF